MEPLTPGRNRTLLLLALLLMSAIALGFGEIAIRLVSAVNPETGVRLLGGVPFLPLRPEASAAEQALARAATSTYVVQDPDLGWSLKPDGAAGKYYTATAQGLRGVPGTSAAAEVAPGRFRLSVYGDSFTHGDQVALEDTWAVQLEKRDPRFEVLNFGVPAYGTDQAYLRFARDGRKFSADVQLLGIWPEDIARNLSIVRFYLVPNGGVGGSKPRFVLDDGGIRLINSPVMGKEAFLDTLLQRDVSPLVAEHDFWYRPEEQDEPFYYHLQTVRAALSVRNAYARREIRNRLYFEQEGEGLRLAVAIAERFRAEAEATGSRAFIGIIPMRDILEEQRDGRFPLAAMLKARSIPVIDFGPTLAKVADTAGADALFLPDGHLTPRGNGVLAGQLAEQFAAQPAAP